MKVVKAGCEVAAGDSSTPASGSAAQREDKASQVDDPGKEAATSNQVSVTPWLLEQPHIQQIH